MSTYASHSWNKLTASYKEFTRLIEDRKSTARCRSTLTAGLAAAVACDWPHGTVVKKLKLPEKNADSCNQHNNYHTNTCYTVQTVAQLTSSSAVAEKSRCRACQFWTKCKWQSFGGHYWAPNWMYSLSCRSLSLLHSFVATSVNITISHILLKTRFFGLHFSHRPYRFIFNHLDIMSPQSYRICWDNAK